MSREKKSEGDLPNTVSRELLVNMNTGEANTEQMMHLNFDEEEQEEEDEEPIDNSQD